MAPLEPARSADALVGEYSCGGTPQVRRGRPERPLHDVGTLRPVRSELASRLQVAQPLPGGRFAWASRPESRAPSLSARDPPGARGDDLHASAGASVISAAAAALGVLRAQSMRRIVPPGSRSTDDRGSSRATARAPRRPFRVTPSRHPSHRSYARRAPPFRPDASTTNGTPTRCLLQAAWGNAAHRSVLRFARRLPWCRAPRPRSNHQLHQQSGASARGHDSLAADDWRIRSTSLRRRSQPHARAGPDFWRLHDCCEP